MPDQHAKPNSQMPLGGAHGAADMAVPPPHQWLALKEASDFLGVHFTTLRTWADNGDIPVFRTPGGHRRFGLDDLRRFLSDRGNQLTPSTARGLVDVAVGRVRQELQRTAPAPQRWQYPLQGAAQQARRQRGQQLFVLAVSYVMKPGQRERLIENGRELGREYGREAAQSGVGLAETGRAVQFFRSQFGRSRTPRGRWSRPGGRRSARTAVDRPVSGRSTICRARRLRTGQIGA